MTGYYVFPQISELPKGIPMDLFKTKHGKYYPGCIFQSYESVDSIDLNFYTGDLDDWSSEYKAIPVSKIVTVTCRKATNEEVQEYHLEKLAMKIEEMK